MKKTQVNKIIKINQLLQLKGQRPSDFKSNLIIITTPSDSAPFLAMFAISTHLSNLSDKLARSANR